MTKLACLLCKALNLSTAARAMLGVLIAMALASPAVAQDAKSGSQGGSAAPSASVAASTESSARAPDLVDVIVYSNTVKEAPDYLPSPGKPVWYFAMAGGFQHIGDKRDDNSEKVAAEQVWKYLGAALASQGYRSILPVTKDTKEPQLLIVFQWGTAVPKLVEDPGAVQYVTQLSGGVMDESELSLDDGFKRLVNGKEIGSLIGAGTVSPTEPEYYNVILPATKTDRYFVIVSAYDFALANSKPPKKKLIWQTRMSVPTARTELAAVLQPLVHNGAPFFGRETKIVKQVTWDRTKVDIGETKVIEYLPPTTPPKSK